MEPLAARPMLAIAGQTPTKYGDFAVEGKSTRRGIAILRGSEVTLVSRNGAVITRTFPDVTAALRASVDHRSVILTARSSLPTPTVCRGRGVGYRRQRVGQWSTEGVMAPQYPVRPRRPRTVGEYLTTWGTVRPMTRASGR